MITVILISIALLTISIIIVAIKDNPCYSFLALLLIPILVICGSSQDNLPLNYHDSGYYVADVKAENGKDITIIFKEYKEENNCVMIPDCYLRHFSLWNPRIYDYEHISYSIIIKVPDGEEFQFRYYQGKNKGYQGRIKEYQRIIEDCEK